MTKSLNKERRMMKASVKERLLAKVVEIEGCWIFTGYRNAQGYGVISTGRHQETVQAHRAAYEMFVGPIPDGLLVLHHCDEPACINPDHLYCGDPKDNADDREARGRHHDCVGSANSNAQLNEAKVGWIKLWLFWNYEPWVIAERYGVVPYMVSKIKRGDTWRHVPIEDPEDCPPELWPPEAMWPLVKTLGLERRI